MQITQAETVITTDSEINQLSCGVSHVCVLSDPDRAECAGGSLVGREGELRDDMKSGVLALLAGKYRTCVLKAGQVICKGKPLLSTSTNSLAEID